MKKESQMPAFDALLFISMPEKSDETRLMKELKESATSLPCPVTEPDG